MANTPVPFEVLVRWIESNGEYRVPVKHIFPTSVEEVMETKAHVALLNIVLGNTRLNDIQRQYLAQTFLLFNNNWTFILWVKRWRKACSLIMWKTQQEVRGSEELSNFLYRLKFMWLYYDPLTTDPRYKSLHAFLYPHRHSLGLGHM